MEHGAIHTHNKARQPGTRTIAAALMAASRRARPPFPQRVLAGEISRHLVIATPKMLGELRKRYDAKLTDALVGEIHKDLTRHSIPANKKAIAAA